MDSRVIADLSLDFLYRAIFFPLRAVFSLAKYLTPSLTLGEYYLNQHFGVTVRCWDGRQWSSPPTIIHTLCNTLPMSVGRTCDLLVTNRMWQKWWTVTLVISPFKIVNSIFSADSPFYCLQWSKLPYWGGPHGKKLRAASGQQPARNWGPQSSNLKGSESWQ